MQPQMREKIPHNFLRTFPLLSPRLWRMLSWFFLPVSSVSSQAQKLRYTHEIGLPPVTNYIKCWVQHSLYIMRSTEICSQLNANHPVYFHTSFLSIRFTSKDSWLNPTVNPLHTHCRLQKSSSTTTTVLWVGLSLLGVSFIWFVIILTIVYKTAIFQPHALIHLQILI